MDKPICFLAKFANRLSNGLLSNSCQQNLSRGSFGLTLTQQFCQTHCCDSTQYELLSIYEFLNLTRILQKELNLNDRFVKLGKF